MEAKGQEGAGKSAEAPLLGEGPKRERMLPRRAIHFLLERIKTHPDAYSPDLLECMAQPWWGELVHGDYIHPDYYQFLNHKSLAKELTEAWASYLKVKQLLTRINPNYRDAEIPSPSSIAVDSTCDSSSTTTSSSAIPSADEAAAELYLFDMCSGKGFNVFIISKMLPGQFNKIYAIDKDHKMNLAHFNSLGGVKFKYADVHHRRFNEWLSHKLGAEDGNEGNRKARRYRKWLAEQQRNKPQERSAVKTTEPATTATTISGDNAEEAEEEKEAKSEEARREEQKRRKRRKRVGIFLGMHLCGELSQTFVGLYNSTPGLAAMVLSPCCLPKHNREPVERAKKLGLDSYSYWALQLYLMVGPGPLVTYKDLSPVEDVLSTKNAFITAIKRPFVNKEGEGWRPDHHHREACPTEEAQQLSSSSDLSPVVGGTERASNSS